MQFKKYSLIIGLLILLEIGICLYIGLAPQGDNYLCSKGSDCETVQNSTYSTIFGIKLAWFGVVSFSLLFILFLIARFNQDKYWMFFTASIIGAGFAVYFISLQVFILNKLCKDCIIIDSIMILMFLIIVFEYFAFKKDIIKIEKGLEKVEAKLYK